MSPEANSRIAELTQRELNGTPPTIEEYIEAIRLLRAGRLSAASAAEASKKGAKAKARPALNGDDLLNEMLGGE